jgi:hypothetical protein
MVKPFVYVAAIQFEKHSGVSYNGSPLRAVSNGRSEHVAAVSGCADVSLIFCGATILAWIPQYNPFGPQCAFLEH